MQVNFLLWGEVKISLRNNCVRIRPELLRSVGGSLWTCVPGGMFLRL